MDYLSNKKESIERLILIFNVFYTLILFYFDAPEEALLVLQPKIQLLYHLYFGLYVDVAIHLLQILFQFKHFVFTILIMHF